MGYLTSLFAIQASTGNVNMCTDVHDHSVLDAYFFDDGTSSHSALEFNENQWTRRLVNALTRSNFEYLQD